MNQAAPPPAQGYNPYPGHPPAYPSQQPPAAHQPPHDVDFTKPVIWYVFFIGTQVFLKQRENSLSM